MIVVMSRTSLQVHPTQSIRSKSMRHYFFIAALLLMVCLGVSGLSAQPPGLPSAPSQAPIDGGLSLLAAAGGAYALKKLRSKKEGV